MTKRIPGYYWVYWIKADDWIIAEYDGLHWFAAGFEDPIDAEINEYGAHVPYPKGRKA